jgi:wyosine [tRNA(Phe)-imidazoG37] synthetase (radical SAM superfamily)
MNDKPKEKLAQSPVYGPVPSRRLGMSLGIDLVPMKVCTYDCIYCELGKTTEKTPARKEYVPETLVLRAIENYFSSNQSDCLDYVTFAGSGEPTLNSSIGSMIAAVKKISHTPVAVLTNGSLLYLPEVRHDLMNADLVVPSLDAATDDVFHKVNRPVPGLHAALIADGIRQFVKEFNGETWLEILFVKGVNDTPKHIRYLVEMVERIQPTKVQLSTVFRPPGAGSVSPVSSARLHEIGAMIDGPVEIVSDFNRRANAAFQDKHVEEIEAMLRIRPVTVEDLAASLGTHRTEVIKYLDQIRKEKTVGEISFLGKVYFTMDR